MAEVYEREGVKCVEMTFPLMGKVFVFLVDGMLIDAGPQLREAELRQFYGEHRIDLVALTHNHEDHSGTAAWIEENLDVPIYVHGKGVELCHLDTPYPEYRIQTWGTRAPFKPQPFGETIASRGRNWQVIETPGHAADHVALYDGESKMLFTGDLFVTPRTKVIMEDESIPQIMDSVRKLLEYDFSSLFCSHAGYVENGKEKMKEKLDYLENLSEKVRQLHAQGMAQEAIRDELIPKPYPIIAISGGQWDSLHIVNSILGK